MTGMRILVQIMRFCCERFKIIIIIMYETSCVFFSGTLYGAYTTYCLFQQVNAGGNCDELQLKTAQRRASRSPL